MRKLLKYAVTLLLLGTTGLAVSGCSVMELIIQGATTSNSCYCVLPVVPELPTTDGSGLTVTLMPSNIADLLIYFEKVEHCAQVIGTCRH